MDKEKHLFIFSAAWCNPCRMMKAFVWDDPSVKEKLNSFTSVNFIDIDDPNNRDIVMQYRVSAIPMVYIEDGKGVTIRVGSPMDVGLTVSFLK